MSTQLPQRFGKYILMNKIAMGGMAEIYRAKTVGAEGFEKELAIKRILPHFTEDESFVKMFIDEATIAAKLHHANIVQIFDFDMIDGSYYIAMEYIEGKDVKRIIDVGIEQNKPLNIFQSVHIIIEVCKGLHYAHTKKHKNKPLNIIHRDISPHNIMVSYQGEVKLMDFGIAKAASRSTKTRAGTVKGKCAYMSPEQARGKPLDPRSDLFAIGIVLWELVTYRRLFLGDSDFETLSNVLKADVTPPSQYNPSVPKDLERIIFKSLAKDRDERYASVAEFLKDLNQFYYSNVVDIDSIALDKFMQELFSPDYRALQEMQASERTAFVDEIRMEQQAEREASEKNRDRGPVRRPSAPQLKPVEPAPQPKPTPQPVVTADQLASGEIAADATIPMSGVEEYMQKMGVPKPGEEAPAKTMALSPDQIASGPQSYPSQPQLRPVGGGPQPQPVQGQYPPHTGQAPQYMSHSGFPAQQQYHPHYTPQPMQAGFQEEPPKRRWGLIFIIIIIIAGGLGGTAYYLYTQGGGDSSEKQNDGNEKNNPPKSTKVKFTLNVTPANAKVVVDGNELKGPPFVYEGDPGKEVTVKISSPGFKAIARLVKIRSEAMTVNYSLDKVVVAGPPATLTLKTLAGASVKINGEMRPNNGTVIYRGHQNDKLEIEIYKPGYILAKKSITLTKDETLSIELESFKGTATIVYPYER
ncbi:MAG: protein kinase, partial [Myxococcales bacterium]|nr:protein kinase [Myxococcales bacterium]